MNTTPIISLFNDVSLKSTPEQYSCKIDLLVWFVCCLSEYVYNYCDL